MLSIFLCRNSLVTKSTISSFFLGVINHGLTSPKLLQYCFSPLGTSFFWNFYQHKEDKIPTRKGKYPVLWTNGKPQQLIKHTKMFYSITSCVFCKFSYHTYLNVYTKVPRNWGTSSTSKSTNCVSLIPFVGNPHFSTLVHRVRYLKN